MNDNKKKIKLDKQFFEQAVFSIADGYCRINLTKDLVPGVMYQVLDGVEYDLNQQLGVPENSSFSELVELWALTIPEEGREEFLETVNREKLLERFYKGEQHVLKKQGLFVNLTEGLFFQEEMAGENESLSERKR